MQDAMITLPAIGHVDAAAKAWLQRCANLALAYSVEVHGVNLRAHATDLLILHLAASALWHATGGKPCWSVLDPVALDVELEGVAVWESMGPDAWITVFSFYCFLAKYGHVSNEAAAVVQERIHPRVKHRFDQLLGAPCGPWAVSRAPRRRGRRRSRLQCHGR